MDEIAESVATEKNDRCPYFRRKMEEERSGSNKIRTKRMKNKIQALLFLFCLFILPEATMAGPPAPPDPFSLYSPSDNTQIFTSTYTLLCNATTDPNGDNINYIFKVDDDINFGSIDLQKTEGPLASGEGNYGIYVRSDFDFSSLARGTTYYWKVTAQDVSKQDERDSIEVWGFYLVPPDLTLSSSDITFSNDSPAPDEVITISATIHNNGGTYSSVTGGNTAGPGDNGVGNAGDSQYTYIAVNSGSEITGDGTLTQWKVYFRTAGGTVARLKIFYDDGSNYILRGESNQETITPGSVLTFDCNIDVQQGDLVGIWWWTNGTSGGAYIEYDYPTDGGAVYQWGYISGSTPKTAWTTYAAVIKLEVSGSGTFIGFYDGDPDSGGTLIENKIVSDIPASGSATTFTSWTYPGGSHDIYVKADPNNIITESDETNNKAFKNIAGETIPPNAVTDLSAQTGDGGGQIKLSWTCPGDDGTTGDNTEAAEYIVRYATFSCESVGSTTTWWNHVNVSTYTQSWSVNAQGTLQEEIVGGLEPGTTYYFAIKTVDKCLDVSDIDERASSATTQAKAYASTAAYIIGKLAFTTSSQTLIQGQISSSMTVQTQSLGGVPTNVGENKTINLDSTSTNYEFSLSSTNWISVNSVTILSGENSASFYYKDYVTGNPTITASESPSEDWQDGTQQETINAATLPDFLINSSDISFSDPNPIPDDTITIYATVHNDGASYDGTLTGGHTAGAGAGNVGGEPADWTMLLIDDCAITGDGAITEWKCYFGTADGVTAKLKIFYIDGSNYCLRGESDVENITQGVVNTFSCNIDVQAGDIVGIYFAGTSAYIGYDGTTNGCAIQSGDISGSTAISSWTEQAFDTIKLEVSGGIDITAKFYQGDPDSGGTQINSTQTIVAINGYGGTSDVSVDWTTPSTPGDYDIYVRIDEANDIEESNEGNNEAHKSITVAGGYKLKQKNWRWYNDEANVTPTISLGAENTSCGIVALSGVAVKLRVTLTEVGAESRDNVRMRLQYSTDDVNFYNVGEIGSAEIWRYYNGGGEDDAALPSYLLSDALTTGTHNESGTASSTYDFAASATPEFEFTIQNNGASISQTYYFRVWDNSSNAAVDLVSGKSHPQVVTAVAKSTYAFGYYGYKLPRIVKSSDGTIYVSYQGGGATTTVDIARSKDNGETWESSWQTASNENYAATREGMAIDADGNLHVAWSDARTGVPYPHSIYYRRWVASTSSWDDEICLHDGTAESRGGFDVTIAVDSNNYVYIAHCAGMWDLRAWKSSLPYNSSNAFSTLNPPATKAQSIGMVVDPSNNLHLMFYDYNQAISQRYLKYDGGWSAETQISDNQGEGQYSSNYGSCDIDNTGKFHAIWRNNMPACVDPMEFKYRNRDSGGTWSSPVAWEPTSTEDRWSFDVGVKNDGSIIYIIYWDDDKNLQYKKSTDGGSNWDSPVLLSDGGDNMHPTFFGAYWPSYNRVTDRLDYVWQKGSEPYYLCYNYIDTTPGDTTPPAAITNLSALTGDDDGEIKLTWSAPGDDGWDDPINGGKYGIKYSTYTPFNFNGPSGFNLEWSTDTTPSASELKVVTGLTPGVTYYFRIWTADEVPLWSGISNGATTWAAGVAPAAITNLSALTGDSEGEIKLTWSAPGDDGTTGDIDGGRYGIKYATYTPFNFDGPSGFNLEWSTDTTPGASEAKVVTGLTGGVTYYFRIWTGDEVPFWSGISNGATTWAQVDVTAPEAITNLSALTGDNEGEVKLSWSAPGDDEWDNPINGGKYGIKYATYTPFNFNGPSGFDLQWSTDTTSGASEAKVVTGLTAGVTYYFRIWTRDEVPLWSGISNGATTWAAVSGLIQETLTVNWSGETHNTIQAAVDAITADNPDLVSANKNWTILVYDDDGTLVENVSVTGFTTDATHNITIRAQDDESPVVDGNATDPVFTITNVNYVTISGFEVTNAGGVGAAISMSGSNSTVSNNHVHDNNSVHGISITGANFLIDRNKVHHTTGANGGNGIRVNTISPDGTIQNNIVYSNDRSGINSMGETNCKIINNTIYKNNTEKGATNYGIRLPNTAGVSDYIIQNNIIWVDSTYCIFVYAGSIISDYNDLYNDGGDGIGEFPSGTKYATLSAWRSGTGQDANSLENTGKTNGVDPIFVDTETFKLSTISPCVDKGTSTVNTPDYDFDNQSRTIAPPPDIGADELDNLNPNDPTAGDLYQYEKDGSPVITVGNDATETNGVKLVLSASGELDPDNDNVKLQVEVSTITTAFKDEVMYSGSFVDPPGTDPSVTIVLPDGDYHWQARLMDTKSGVSNWVSFGGNSDPNDKDFGIPAALAPTRTMKQYRWYDSDDVALGIENGMITVLTGGTTLHLRIGIEVADVNWNVLTDQVRVGLERDTNESFSGPTQVQTSEFWDDSDHSNGTALTRDLSGSDVNELFVEMRPSSYTNCTNITVGNQGEWDFAIVPPTIGGTYYYRLILVNADGNKCGVLDDYLVKAKIKVSPPPVRFQKHYHWYDADDGSLAAEDTEIDTSASTDLHLRLGVENTGGPWYAGTTKVFTASGETNANLETVTESYLKTQSSNDIREELLEGWHEGAGPADWNTLGDDAVAENSHYWDFGIIDAGASSYTLKFEGYCTYNLSEGFKLGWSEDAATINWLGNQITNTISDAETSNDLGAIGGKHIYIHVTDLDQTNTDTEGNADTLYIDYLCIVAPGIGGEYISVEFDTTTAFTSPGYATLWDDLDNTADALIKDPPPSFLTGTSKKETYIETRENSPTNQNNLDAGDQGEWDFAITAPGSNGTYYYRFIITDSGGNKKTGDAGIIDTYTVYPELFIGAAENIRYWVATSTSNWNSTANWSETSGGSGGASVPTAGYEAVFNGVNSSTGTCQLDMAVTVTTITITSGYTGTFDTQNYDVTVSSSFSQAGGTVALGASVVTINGDMSLTGGNFVANTSTVTFNGSGSQTLTPGASSFYHVVINKSGGSLTLGGALDINGNFTLTSGTFDTNGYAITCAEDWNRSGGNFTVTGSTVTFDNASSTSTLIGSTTFYALVSTETAKTIKFSSNTITYVTGHLNFENVILRSTLDGATWYLNLSGTQDVSGVDVQDSNASGGTTINAGASSTDFGNNTNWDFGPPAAITNLSALTGDSEGEVKLSWSAPGDNGWDDPINGGKYGIKYATYTAFNFNGPSGFDLEWSTDTTSGASELKVVTGLTPGVTYYFRIWTGDEVPFWSGISNGATTWAPGVAPAAITNLSALTGDDDGEIKLTWSAPGDDGWDDPINGGKYGIKYATYTAFNFNGPSGFNLEWSTDTTSGASEAKVVTGLTAGVTYYFRIWTADEVPLWSGISNGATTWAAGVAPAAITYTGGSGDGFDMASGANFTPATSTYYFDAYNEGGEQWETEPWNMVNGTDDSYASTDNSTEVQWLTSNTCPGIDLGTIFKVELRAYGYYITSDDTAKLRPVFTAGDGDDHDGAVPSSPGWGQYIDITTDTNAPSPWTWAAVQDLDCDVEYYNPGGEANIVYVGEVEIWVTYTPAGDTTPPAAITNLSALTGDSEGEIKLTWSAPGDDGTTGDIDGGRYGIKYATYTPFNFDGPSGFDLQWSTDTTSGASEAKVVTGLTAGVTYYFRIWTADEVPLWSGISNGATTWAQVDVTAPEAITNLSALTGDNEGEVKLSWSAPGDDEWDNPISGGKYGIKYATYTPFNFNGPSGFDLQWSTDTTSGASEAKVVTGLTPGVTYYFRIWTRDEVPNWSGISNGATTWAQVDVTAPAGITTLLASSYDTEGGIELTWEAPGDDDWSGTLGTSDDKAQFRVKYATFTTVSWSTSTYNIEIDTYNVTPHDVQTVITTLTKETTYYFRIWTRDEASAGNWSDISYGATTYCLIAPAAISDLTGLCNSDTGKVTLYWSTPGDDDWTNTLPDGSKYIIDYSTYSIQWSTENYKVSISTYGVAPHTRVSHTITGLTGDTTWYFQIWTRDEIPTNWSGLSNGTTVWVNPILSVSISTDTYNFGEVALGVSTHTVSVITVTNEGNVRETYWLKISSVTLYDNSSSLWKSTDTTTGTGYNRFVFYAIFHGTDVALGYFKANDIVVEESRFSTSVQYTHEEGSTGYEQTGVGIPSSEERKIWFRLDMPTSTTTGKKEKIRVTVTAGPE